MYFVRLRHYVDKTLTSMGHLSIYSLLASETARKHLLGDVLPWQEADKYMTSLTSQGKQVAIRIDLPFGLHRPQITNIMAGGEKVVVGISELFPYKATVLCCQGSHRGIWCIIL